MSFGATHSKKPRRGRTVIKDTGIDIEKGEGFYGIVTKLLGDNRLIASLNNGSEVQVTFGNKFRKKIWFKLGDIVLINDSYEIEQRIDKDNKRLFEAQIMMNKISTTSSFFKKDEEEEEDGFFDSDVEHNVLEKKISKPVNKSKQEKTMTKRGGGEKIFTDPEELKKDNINNKQVYDDTIIPKVDDDFNIDDL